jgi:hypothetical protein
MAAEKEQELAINQDDYDALKGKLDQFRSNNVKLMKEKESLESKYADVDQYTFIWLY